MWMKIRGKTLMTSGRTIIMTNFSLLADVISKTKIIWAIVVLVLFIFVILGVIGLLIGRIMKWQGRTIDKLMFDLVKTHVVNDKRNFRRIASIKSRRYFFKQSWIPILMMIVASIFILIFMGVTNSWGMRILTDHGDQTTNVQGTGLATLFFVWDFSGIFTSMEGGFQFSAPILVNTPHFAAAAWQSYAFFFVFGPGFIWFLGCVMCYISRFIRIRTAASRVFRKNLDTLNAENLGDADKPLL